jgi:hypothetical protein
VVLHHLAADGVAIPRDLREGGRDNSLGVKVKVKVRVDWKGRALHLVCSCHSSAPAGGGVEHEGGVIHEQQAGPLHSHGAAALGGVVEEQDVREEEGRVAGEEDAAARNGTVPFDEAAEEGCGCRAICCVICCVTCS